MQDFGGTKRGIHPPSKACIGQGDLTSAAKKFDPARMLVSKGKGGAAAVVRIEARKAAGACSSRGGPPLRISSSCAEDVREHGERSTEHAGMQQL
jgi:hypothetical protein